ncbi:MAG: aconitase/3-isopropylmalate dehydratase large subunit family protein [Candidatus Thermoplasmatota archaeon]|nr:aconitase/3-isopropylmalate dehydratase large subunit family protein [Candidatus Thermoplasmatota archaeon]
MDNVNPSLGLEILEDHLVEGSIDVGSYSIFSPDVIMGHDVTSPPAVEMLNEAGFPFLRASDRTRLYLDHFTPPKDRKSAEACRLLREFSGRYGVNELVDWGEGICHVHLFENGRVIPKQLVIGADSHITTGGALGALCIGIGSTDLAVAMASGEFWLEVPEPLGISLEGTPDVWCEGKDIALRMISWLGPGGARGRIMEIDGEILRWLGDDGRYTISNLAAETSCTSSIITTEFPESGPLSPDWSFPTETIELDEMGPQVAVPDSPNNVEPVENVNGKIIDQVFIGSCTNGRLDDIRLTAKILKGQKVHEDVRLLVIPGSRGVYSAADRAGYLKTIIDAGGVISMPTCGPCAGGFLGVLPDGEHALATTNRNFKGRMGETSSKVYLSGVAVAAASAIMGMISHPEEVTR